MPIIQTDKPLCPRQANDFYPTPVELAREAVRPYALDGKRVLDAGAGTGAWGEAVKQIFPKAHVVGIDLTAFPLNDSTPKYDSWVVGDFLQYKHTADIVVGNPPYIYAEEFVRHALTLAPMVCFLLRIDFLASEKRRKGLYSERILRRVDVCSRRPSFTGNRRTDSDTYAVFHFLQDRVFVGPTLGWLEWEYDERP